MQFGKMNTTLKTAAQLLCISGICVRNSVNRLENQILSRLSGEWDTKLKNNYRKLKLSILLQTVFITALTVLVGRFILEYFIDGIYNDSFSCE